MQVTHFNEPIPYVIIDDFVTEFDRVSDIALDLFCLTDLGSHGDYKDNIVKRNEFYLYSKVGYPEVDELISKMKDVIWSDESRAIYDNAPYPYPMLNSTTYDGMLIGFYGEGGYYSMHKDTSFLTVLVYLHKEKNFDGGDLILSNKTDPFMNREYASTNIEALPNRAVIFPSCYFHGVSDLKPFDSSVDSMRISYTCFTGFKIK